MIFKFLIPIGDEREVAPGVLASGKVAVIRAATLVEAHSILYSECASLGVPSWDAVATVTDETDTIGIIALAM